MSIRFGHNRFNNHIASVPKMFQRLSYTSIHHHLPVLCLLQRAVEKVRLLSLQLLQSQLLKPSLHQKPLSMFPHLSLSLSVLSRLRLKWHLFHQHPPLPLRPSTLLPAHPHHHHRGNLMLTRSQWKTLNQTSRMYLVMVVSFLIQ